MFGLGIGEIALVLIIALIFLGPKKLPELATNLGKGIREFNRARQGFMDEIERPIKDGLNVNKDNKTDASFSPMTLTSVSPLDYAKGIVSREVPAPVVPVVPSVAESAPQTTAALEQQEQPRPDSDSTTNKSV